LESMDNDRELNVLTIKSSVVNKNGGYNNFVDVNLGNTKVK